MQVAAEEQLRGVDRHRAQAAAEAFLLSWFAVLIEGLTDMQPMMMCLVFCSPCWNLSHGTLSTSVENVPYETYKETHSRTPVSKECVEVFGQISLCVGHSAHQSWSTIGVVSHARLCFWRQPQPIVSLTQSLVGSIVFHQQIWSVVRPC